VGLEREEVSDLELEPREEASEMVSVGHGSCLGGLLAGSHRRCSTIPVEGPMAGDGTSATTPLETALEVPLRQLPADVRR
jgi:hypothetical protein